MPALRFDIVRKSPTITSAFIRITRYDGMVWNPDANAFESADDNQVVARQNATMLESSPVESSNLITFEVPYDPTQFQYGDYRATFYVEENGVVSPAVSGTFWLIPDPWSDTPFISKSGGGSSIQSAGF